MKKRFLGLLVLLSWLGYSQEENIVIEKDSISNEESVSYAIIEEVPVFSGCTGESNYELRACFNKKMQLHVQKHFNMANMKCKRYEKKLKETSRKEKNKCIEELPKGIIRIKSWFRITKNGTVDIMKIEAPSERLKNEVIRVLKKLPKFKPGIQRGRTVNVGYYLPINFRLK